jgi:hypothetical protein
MSESRDSVGPRWRWGKIQFDGLFGLHGEFLCYHRPEGPAELGGAVVDPAKPIIPLLVENSLQLSRTDQREDDPDERG